MEAFSVNKEVWDNIYKSGHQLRYPNENLVRLTYWVFNNQDVKKMKLLDYGFGPGNNLEFLQGLGFEVYGVEISEIAKKITLSRLPNNYNGNNLVIMHDDINIPFRNGFFDVVVAWQVLYYNSLERLQKVLEDIQRVLKRGGKLIATMCRGNDLAVINSSKISTYERIVNEKIPSQERAVIIVLETEEMIKKVFAPFSNLQIGFFEYKWLNTCGSHWTIFGEKE